MREPNRGIRGGWRRFLAIRGWPSAGANTLLWRVFCLNTNCPGKLGEEKELLPFCPFPTIPEGSEHVLGAPISHH